MLQQIAEFSQKPVVRAGMKQKLFSSSDPSPATGSTSSFAFFDICSQLQSNSVIALSSLAAEGEGKFYGVRCLVGGVWSLQMQAGLQPYDPAVQLVVVNQNGKFGLRSAIAEGRLLCCNRNYHLAFERWEMDFQEAWSLQGSSLSDCTLRNVMHKLTLNIRITVLAEPTDILGNTRITSALMTTSLSGLDVLAASKSNSASSSYVKERVVQQDQKDSHESPRLFLVKPGSNTKSLNPFTHQRDRNTSQTSLSDLIAKSSKTGGQGKLFLSSSKNPHESNGTSLPGGGVYTFSSLLKSDSPRYYPHRTHLLAEEGKAYSNILPYQSSATNWKQTTPSREEVQLSSFPATMRTVVPETQSNARQGPYGNNVLGTGVHPSNPSPSENPRKVRKWKRNSEGNHKVSYGDLDGCNRPNCGLKRSQIPLDIDNVDEDGTFLSPDSSNRSSSPRVGGHWPQVVIKRQTGFLAANFDMFPKTPQSNVKGKASDNSGEKLKYSRSQLEAAHNNLRIDTARQEKEKVIHWKLQAAVRLLKSETQQKLTLIAKTALEEANAQTKKEDMKKENWFSKDELSEKRGVSWKDVSHETCSSFKRGGRFVGCFFYGSKQLFTFADTSETVVFFASATSSSSLCNTNLSEEKNNRLENALQLPMPNLVMCVGALSVTVCYLRVHGTDTCDLLRISSTFQPRLPSG